jgi:hypothetical protein
MLMPGIVETRLPSFLLPGHSAPIGHGGQFPRLRSAHLVLGTDPDHQAFTGPKLYIAVMNEPLGFLDRLGVVRAYQRLATNEMPVLAHSVRPVLSHAPF